MRTGWKKFRTGGTHSEMSDRWTGTAANTARMFSPPPSLHPRRLLPLYVYIPTLLTVSTSQYPIRPIRKYSRGVICRGRRCPIGRHRFFRRRAPRASAAVARTAPLRGALALPRLHQRVSCTIASVLISFSPDCTSPPLHRAISNTHTHKYIGTFARTSQKKIYKNWRTCVIRLYK